MKKSQKATEALFRATHFLIKKKKAFSDGEVVKEAIMIIANTVIKDRKNGTNLNSPLSNIQQWQDKCQLFPVTWLICWTGIWRSGGGLVSSGASPWTAAV